MPWHGGGTIKLSYVADTPEAQVKLQDCFALREHPTLCKGRLPVQLQLCTPDSKRLASTSDWPSFVAREWPKHRQAVANKFPRVIWR
jgi:ATP-dependent helicase HrpB